MPTMMIVVMTMIRAPLRRIIHFRDVAVRSSSLPSSAMALSTFAKQVTDLAEQATAGAYVRKVDASNPQKTVLLLHPPGACSAFTRSGSQYPPLGLKQLKAVIGNPALVDVLEADGRNYSNDETVDWLSRIAPTAIGMTVTCGTKRLVHAWSAVAKHLSPEYCPLVLVGGPAAAFESASIFDECPHVDVVVKGEGEVTFPDIVRILQNSNGQSRSTTLSALSQLAGVCVRGMPELNDRKIPTLPKDAFETLPFPDLSSSPVAQYAAPDAKRHPMVTMMTQRGCIAQCAFCNTPQIHGRQMRGWSNERIVQELQHLIREHGIREVSFVDDVFTNRPGGPRKLCELMVQEQLDLTWYCNVRADQITPRMAAAMKAAGCHQVFMGFESGCDEMLLRIQKGERVADLERGAAILKGVGIHISIGFIVGLPGETDESVRKSIELCRRVEPHRVQFTRFTPIPGSMLAEAAQQQQLHGSTELSAGFHDRSNKDQVEAWLQQCYEACPYRPSV